MPLDRAVLVEPTAVAVHDVGRAEVTEDEKVVVVGGGPVRHPHRAGRAGPGRRGPGVELSAHRRLLAEK